MSLPYEKQIMQLLQELGHYQVIIRRCRREKLPYMEELRTSCKEIEQAVYELEEKQQLALSQWRSTPEEERSRILFHLTDGLEQMNVLAEKKGCKAIGEYLEAFIMDEILELLDSTA